MRMGLKKILAIATMVILPLAFTGCQKKGMGATCKSDKDCRVDASGKEVNGVCYMGKCEECAADSDCSDLKQCVNHRCTTACQTDSECGANQHCFNSFCVPNCSESASCPNGHSCSLGRCVADAGADRNAWAANECQGLGTVQFDFDRYEVKSDYRDQAERLAQCLEKNPGYVVTIEGHADDRGTPSYNDVLGQKRADATKKYLSDNWGIAANRMKTVSYGDQRPVMSGSNEQAWFKNRRAEFVLVQN